MWLGTPMQEHLHCCSVQERFRKRITKPAFALRSCEAFQRTLYLTGYDINGSTAALPAAFKLKRSVSKLNVDLLFKSESTM